MTSRTALYFLVATCFPILLWGQSSVLSSGSWLKVGVVQEGAYRLDYEFLQAHGVPVGSLDPATLQFFGNGGGILPQSNSTARPIDLIENPVMLLDGGDGAFGEGDYLVFYGRGSDNIHFDPEADRFVYEDNIYSDSVFYFLTWDQNAGQRVETLPVPDEPGNTQSTAFGFTVHDLNELNLVNSGRLWLGENFEKSGARVSARLTAPFLAAGATQYLEASVMGASLADGHFRLEAEGTSVGTVSTTARPDAASYIRGFTGNAVLPVPGAAVAGQLDVDIWFETAHPDGFGFLDHLVLTTRSPLAYSGSNFKFTTDAQPGPSVFEISGYEPGLVLWDVSNPVAPSAVAVESSGRFKAHTDVVREFHLFDPLSLPLPATAQLIPNQNLRALANIDFLIVAHGSFEQAAERLAAHRAAHSGMEAEVVSVDKIYNEFSSGAQDITAIRDFIRHLYARGNLRYVLLFGDGSYDYRDRVPDNTNFVPTYQSRNSLDRVATYASDDYYGFLGAGEGNWPEEAPDAPTLDVAVGRIPARSLEEANIAVDKIIHYDEKSDFGDWRTNVLYSADDGDENLHQRDADLLAEYVVRNFQSIEVDKLYLDAFPQENRFSAEAQGAFVRAVHEGKLVVNYLGHGNELQLAVERLVTDIDIRGWRNLDRLPLLVTATCEFGVFDNPDWFSAGEQLIFEPKGGAIGLVTATRLVYTNSNFQLSSAFTQEVFAQGGADGLAIGDVFRRVKNRSISGINNRNYVLLGDPSLTLKYPSHQLRIDSVLDMAGQHVDHFESFYEAEVFGSVVDEAGVHLSGFEGEVKLAFIDQPVPTQTLGDENEPFGYNHRSSMLFNGRATVNEGRFSMKMLLPDGVSTSTDEARIVLYGVDTLQGIDASGGTGNVEVLQTGLRQDDGQPPSLEIFLGDTLFRSGNSIAATSPLLIRLKDGLGINLSTANAGQSLKASWNGNEILLNQYYATDLDTYKSGWVEYMLRDMAPGSYTLTVQACDLAGNCATQTVDFRVLSTRELPINNFTVAPNPSDGDVRFSFQHNREEEELYVRYEIVNMLGVEVFRSAHVLVNAPPVVDDLVWSREAQHVRELGPGMYLYRFHISALDGASKNLTGRIILR